MLFSCKIWESCAFGFVLSFVCVSSFFLGVLFGFLVFVFVWFFVIFVLGLVGVSLLFLVCIWHLRFALVFSVSTVLLSFLNNWGMFCFELELFCILVSFCWVWCWPGVGC